MEQLLSRLKAIEPNKEYRERSRVLILNSQQISYPTFFNRILDTIQYGAAYSLAIIFIFLLVGGLSMFSRGIYSPAVISNLDPQTLKEESENFDIQIQLSQAEYYENSAKTIEIALNATSDEIKTNNDKERLDELLKELTL
ncbi:MAG: hypothetical protein HZB99_03925 [Candidatus Harrisonbacteria bacterium]|nr:hypothetical protein [Candidatus Harrisonbacteria bacterium]